MRNLGDLRWLNEWVGIPYRFGGRDEKTGLDCYGLAKLVYLEEYDIVLPDWITDEIDLKGRHDAIDSVVTSGQFTPTETPSDGDFVIAYRTKAAHHLGLFFGGGVLHCIAGSGAIYEPLDRFMANFPRVVFGSWRP